MKHTLGPWRLDNSHIDESHYGFWQVISGDGWYVADIAGNVGIAHIPTVEAEANAKLIAAAPELLEALEGLSDILHNHYGDDMDETPLIDKAFEAIKKAKGL